MERKLDELTCSNEGYMTFTKDFCDTNLGSRWEGWRRIQLIFQCILAHFLWFLFALVVCLVGSAVWLHSHLYSVQTEHSWVHVMILWLLVSCRIPHLPKGAQIIFRGFCGCEFSLRQRKKKEFISPWRLGKGRTREQWKDRQKKVRESISSRGEYEWRKKIAVRHCFPLL